MNIVEFLLKELKVKHSKSFIEKYFVNAPDSNNMLGIQRVLTRYNIETVGIHFDNKEEAGVTFPCILHMGNSFVVGVDLNDDFIRYHDGKEFKEEETFLFNEKWTGNALLITDKQNAKEPGLIRNRMTDLYNTIVRFFLIVVFAVLGVLIISQEGIFNPVSVNVIFDLMGIIICFLLFQKQLFSQADFVDRFCSVLQKGGCDSILNSEKSKFLGIISWTEIGLAYFSSRILCLFLDGHSLPLLQMIGWAAMLYGIWSIWYQTFKAKHWCTLCVIVQIIVWATGIYNIFVCQGLYLSIADAYTFTACFAIVLLIIHVISEYYSVMERYTNITKDFLSFKLQDNIMKAALADSQEAPIDKNDSSIIFGDEYAPITLSVFINPYCHACAKTHKKLMDLIIENPAVNIRYLYSTLDDGNRLGCLYFIALYQQKNHKEALKYIEEWYRNGRFYPNRAISESSVDINREEVILEYNRHKQWNNKTRLGNTPTIIIDGYLMPKYYKVNDFIYLDKGK